MSLDGVLPMPALPVDITSVQGANFPTDQAAQPENILMNFDPSLISPIDSRLDLMITELPESRGPQLKLRTIVKLSGIVTYVRLPFAPQETHEGTFSKILGSTALGLGA